MTTEPSNPLRTQWQSFGSHTLWVGILLVILGSLGIFVPGVLSVATVGLLSGLMLFGGGIWAYHSYQSRHTSDKGLADWFKPLLLIVFGILLLVFPVPGIASLALLLSAYLLMDAYGSFGSSTFHVDLSMEPAGLAIR